MAKATEVDRDLVLSLIHYDAQSGEFSWKKDRTRGVKKGDLIGSKNRGGYLYMYFRRKSIFLHRLAWFIVTGAWPDGDLDHKDGNQANNSFSNLRPATDCEGNRNRGKHRNNTSGFKGVYFRKNRGKWVALARRNGRVVLAKQAETAESAAHIYDAFAKAFDGEFARLNFP